MRKLLSILLSVVMVLGCFSTVAFADELTLKDVTKDDNSIVKTFFIEIGNSFRETFGKTERKVTDIKISFDSEPIYVGDDIKPHVNVAFSPSDATDTSYNIKWYKYIDKGLTAKKTTVKYVCKNSVAPSEAGTYVVVFASNNGGYKAYKEINVRNKSGVYGNFEWCVNDSGGITLTKYNASDATDVVIPAKIQGLPVTDFGKIFRESNITSIKIPDTVTSISGYAFWGCINLTNITLPDNVTSIGDYAFYLCTSLTSVTIPDSVTSIGFGAFFRCRGLKSITIPNSVTEIGNSTFEECIRLKSITIPDSITKIGTCAFFRCTNLQMYIITVLQSNGLI